MKNKLYIKGGVLAIVLLMLLAVVMFFTIKFQGYNISIKDENSKFIVKQKGLKEATSFEFDEEGNTYISFKDKILKVDNKGKSHYILDNSKYDISSITYGNNSLYFFSKDTLFSVDLEGINVTELLSKIPTGDGKNLIGFRQGKVFISIPSSTNAGIASREQVPDITPFEIVSNGVNFGEEKTGVFMPYGLELKEDEKIKGSGIGNASLISYDLNTKTYSTVAWGIKSIGGFDFNKNDEIFATVNGMGNAGERPVTGDSDYIYRLEYDSWYGWPDFSGGDPINSPRFANAEGEINDFIIKNHPTKNPKEPLYIHKNVSALTSIAIDTEGDIGTKKLMYFFDNKIKKLYYINEKGVYKEYGEFGVNANISGMKFFGGKLCLLDSSNGYLVSIEEKNYSYIKANREIFILIIISSISSVVLIKNIVDKLKDKSKNKK